MVACRAMTQNVLDGRAIFVRGQRGALMIGGAFAFRDGNMAALSSSCDGFVPFNQVGIRGEPCSVAHVLKESPRGPGLAARPASDSLSVMR